MNTRQFFLEFARHLEDRDAGANEKLDELIELRNREGQRFWRILANYRDFRSGKNLLMLAAAANHIKLSNLLDPWVSIYERDASGRLCTHFAALGDSAEWMHNFFKRHDDKSVFFKRDYSQQRPVDIAEFFQAFRAQKWIERLQAEEVMRAEALDVPQQIMELLAQHKLDFETLFDQMEGTQMPQVATPKDGGERDF